MTLRDEVDLLVAACKLEDSTARDLLNARCDEDVQKAWDDARQAILSRKRIQEELKKRLSYYGIEVSILVARAIAGLQFIDAINTITLPNLPECSICRRRHGAEVTHACE